DHQSLARGQRIQRADIRCRAREPAERRRRAEHSVAGPAVRSGEARRLLRARPSSSNAAMEPVACNREQPAATSRCAEDDSGARVELADLVHAAAALIANAMRRGAVRSAMLAIVALSGMGSAQASSAPADAAIEQRVSSILSRMTM